MPLTRRLIVARIAILLALVASAALTVDHVRPGPGYCPMEKACEKAASSELGAFLGMPTSVLGLGAFAMLLLLSLPASAMGRRLCLVAGGLGMAAGTCFLLYQAFILKSFCPLCVVADVGAIVAGALLVTDVIARPTRWWRAGESVSAKVAWALGGALAMVSPFAWPQSAPPAFEDAVVLAEEDFAEEELEEEALQHAVPSPPADASREPTGTSAPTLHPTALQRPPQHQTTATQPPPPPPPPPAVGAFPAPKPPAAEEVVRPSPAPVRPAPEPQVKATPKAPPAAPAASKAVDARVRMVEYLNAYCPHCRKMHRRVEKVLAASRIPVKRRRIYAWAKGDYPLWARACAYARSQGREEALFEALMETRKESRGAVFAAARKVGLDLEALAQAVAAEPPPFLVRDRKLSLKARLKGLPTFDIGARRLTGEKSERAVRGALAAAARELRAKQDGRAQE